MLDGIFWILCSGAQWRDLLERFGPWKKRGITVSVRGVMTPRSSTRGMQPIIPHHRMHRHPRPGLPHQFDRPKYRQRNVVERVFD